MNETIKNQSSKLAIGLNSSTIIKFEFKLKLKGKNSVLIKLKYYSKIN